MGESLEDMDYAKSGVSIKAQNDVNAEIARRLRAKGLAAEGLFGGAVDISRFKGRESVPIGIVSASIVEDEDMFQAGRKTAEKAIGLCSGVEAIAMVDYIATPGMDVEEIPSFVEGIATAGVEAGVPTIGGESAEMPGTYNEGKRDAYADVIYTGEMGTTVDIADLIRDMEHPLLCASTDGTGTKTRIVKDPKDIIYHGLNDLGAIGVKPVAFKLYVAGNAPMEELEAIVAKSKAICETLNITAFDATIEQKPWEYAEGQVDIAGTVLGVIDKEDMITGENVEAGDTVIGIASDCLMTNGYSLARKYCGMTKDDWDAEDLPGLEGTTIRKELSKPHVPYTDILFGNENAEGVLSKFGDKIKATAHITGGGQCDNIARMVPDEMQAVVGKGALPLPPIVKYFKAKNANMDSMYEAFNMGVGFTLTVSSNAVGEIAEYINKNFRGSVEGVERTAVPIGSIVSVPKFRWE